MNTTPTIQEVHEQFCLKNNIPYDPNNLQKDLSWNCFAVASVLAEMLKKKKIKARAVYGTWKGKCVSKKESGFFRHGWVLVKEKEIIDPTRWVFENSTPSIFQGNVVKNKEYDEGMIELRSHVERPYPAFNEKTRRVIQFKWSKDCAEMITMLSGVDCNEDQAMSIEQALWMANIPFKLWGKHLDEVYSNLKKESCEAFIPMDFKAKWQALKA